MFLKLFTFSLIEYRSFQKTFLNVRSFSNSPTITLSIEVEKLDERGIKFVCFEDKSAVKSRLEEL